MEIWKKIKDYPRYSVSSLGRVRNNLSGRIKIQSVNTYGYFFVNLYKDDMTKPQPITVHRIVAKSFLKGDGETVNHKNGIKTDNISSNLEWMSRAQNASHAWKSGLTPVLSGESCGKSILDNKKVLKIRSLYAKGISQTEISRMFSVTQANVSAICKNKTWKHI